MINRLQEKRRKQFMSWAKRTGHAESLRDNKRPLTHDVLDYGRNYKPYGGRYK
jgi:hypothetical protein